MTETFLPYGRQVIEEDDIAAVADVLRSDFLTTGPVVDRFEQALAERTGAKHAIACATGTAALHLAALGLGIGEGDVAIVPSVTFAATASCVRLCGGEVVFADVDADTGRTSPAHIEAALARAKGRNVKAIFSVDLAGHPCPREGIAAVAGDIPVVHDACHGLGGVLQNGGRVGDSKMAACETFSFHPVKTIAMGEGGAVTTNDNALAERVRLLRNHGISRDPASWRHSDMGFDSDGSANPWYYELHEPSFNYRVTDFQCALGLSQLAKLDRFAATRAVVREKYDALMPQLAPLVQPLRPEPGAVPVLHLYSVLIDFAALGLSRKAVMEALRARGIGSQVHYIPLHRQPYFKERYGVIELPGADAYYDRALSLPFFAGMTPVDAQRVVDALAEVIGLPFPVSEKSL